MSKPFNVGGVLMDRPFKVRRLGHFHFFSKNMARTLDFYTRVIGFRVSDKLDVGRRFTPEVAASLDDPHLYFTRYSTDHHAFVLCSDQIIAARGQTLPPGVTVGQITWQVGSLSEVVDAEAWFVGQGREILRSGRDTPGSNWHTYTPDPDGHPNELYYGMEQIGWSGHSKPFDMHRGFRQPPSLPQISEQQEIEDATAKGVDVASGSHLLDSAAPFDRELAGVLAPRPFKVTGVGPVRLFAHDIEASLAFYRDQIGMRVTEEVEWNGHRCYFLRVNTEHHSLALYPEALRERIAPPGNSLCLSFGVRVNDYSQLRAAVDYLKDEGIEIRELDPALLPGMDYCAFAVDPDGHMIQLYTHMEQVGWDGRPRTTTERRVPQQPWPETLDMLSDDMCGEVYMGPLA